MRASDRVTVRLVTLDKPHDEIRAELVRRGKRLAVFHPIRSGYGRPGWTMPIDARGMPPKGSHWAWRVHPDDVACLERAP